jgi:hypothetical protein
MTPPRLATLKRALLLIHVMGTAAAAAVLAIWPAAIPAAIEVQLRPDQFIVCYFLSGAEAALCFLCIQALRSLRHELRRTVFQVLIVFHAFTAALSVRPALQTVNLVVALNIGLRVVLIALLAVVIRSRGSDREKHLER